MQIGFIGLGVMGRPMALHLLRGGHQLAVWARRPESLQPLLAAGAVAVPRRPPSARAAKWCSPCSRPVPMSSAWRWGSMAWSKGSPRLRCWST
jgi:pyrroline-5-carboxylate reductase